MLAQRSPEVMATLTLVAARDISVASNDAAVTKALVADLPGMDRTPRPSGQLVQRANCLDCTINRPVAS